METLVVKKKKGVQYFTQETEDSIVLYNNTTDPDVRSRLYNNKIEVWSGGVRRVIIGNLG